MPTPFNPDDERRPRVRSVIGGQPVSGAVKAEVVSNNHYAADRFTLEVALDGEPTFTAAWWSSTADIEIEIQACFLPEGAAEGSAAWKSLFVGAVDSVSEVDIIRRIVRCEGRDLSQRLIEAKTEEAFPNRTASDIATLLAGRHGLTADVAATSTPVGQYYERDHTRTTLNSFSRFSTEWDLLTYLAQQENCDVWVEGRTLHFKPRVDAAAATPLVLAYQPATEARAYPVLPVSDLQLSRSLTLAKDLEVVVQTWDARHKKGTKLKIKAGGSSTPGAKKGAVQRYVLNAPPGMTPSEAQAWGLQQLHELSLHERVVNVTMPGELDMDARSVVSLEGTGTGAEGFDQRYYVDTVTRTISFEGGFEQHVRLKNTSPRSQATVG